MTIKATRVKAFASLAPKLARTAKSHDCTGGVNAPPVSG